MDVVKAHQHRNQIGTFKRPLYTPPSSHSSSTMSPTLTSKKSSSGRGKTRTVLSPSIESDFALLFSIAGEISASQMRLRKLPQSFFNIPGAIPAPCVSLTTQQMRLRKLPQSFWNISGASKPKQTKQSGTTSKAPFTKKLSKSSLASAAASTSKGTTKKVSKKKTSNKTINLSGKVFLPIKKHVTPYKDGPTTPPVAAKKYRNKLKHKRKLHMGDAVKGRLSAPPLDIEADEAPCRSHSLPNLGNLSIVWELAESQQQQHQQQQQQQSNPAHGRHPHGQSHGHGHDSDVMTDFDSMKLEKFFSEMEELEESNFEHRFNYDTDMMGAGGEEVNQRHQHHQQQHHHHHHHQQQQQHQHQHHHHQHEQQGGGVTEMATHQHDMVSELPRFSS